MSLYLTFYLGFFSQNVKKFISEQWLSHNLMNLFLTCYGKIMLTFKVFLCFFTVFVLNLFRTSWVGDMS